MVRNKMIEAGMVLAIGTFTMLSIGTYIHQLNSAQGNSNGVTALVKKTETWLSNRLGQHAGAAAMVRTASVPALANMGSQTIDTPFSRSTSTIDPNGLLNSANDSRMLSIAQELVSHMTTSDWANVMTLLQTSNVDSAQQGLSTLLQSKLSPSDAAWLQAHFQGKQAFNQSDIVLLQQTFKELQNMFTPAEQQMLKQRLQQFGVSLNG